MRVVIVEDQVPLRDSLIQTIHELDSSFQIVGQASGVIDGIKTILSQQPDIVFLDVEIAGGTSFNILDAIPTINFKTVFITGYNHFAIKAIKYSAFDFLLKPVDKIELAETLKRLTFEKNKKDNYDEKLNLLFNQLKGEDCKKIGISSLDSIRYIEVDQIVRIEADRSYSHIVLGNGDKITSSKSLNHYEKILPHSQFFKIHRSHFININFIESLVKSEGGFVIMSDHYEVPISRRRKEEFLKTLDQKLKR